MQPPHSFQPDLNAQIPSIGRSMGMPHFSNMTQVLLVAPDRSNVFTRQLPAWGFQMRPAWGHLETFSYLSNINTV